MTKLTPTPPLLVPIEELTLGTTVTFIHPKYQSFYTGIIKTIIIPRDKSKSIRFELQIALGKKITVSHQSIKYTYPIQNPEKSL